MNALLTVQQKKVSRSTSYACKADEGQHHERFIPCAPCPRNAFAIRHILGVNEAAGRMFPEQYIY